MFDLFGLEKADAKDSIREMMRGCTLGLLDGFEWRLDEKDREMSRLKEQIVKQEEEIEKLKEVSQ